MLAETTNTAHLVIAVASDALTFAGIVVVAIGGPAVTIWATGRRDQKAKIEEAQAARAERRAEAEERRAEKEQDWARLDEVARRAETVASKASETADLLLVRQDAGEAERKETADLLLAEQKQTNDKTDEVARLAAEAALTVRGQLEAIDSQGKQNHALLNSDMTLRWKSELWQTRIGLLSAKKVVAMARAAGDEPSDEDLKLIEDTKARVVTLVQTIEDREAQQATLEARLLEERVALGQALGQSSGQQVQAAATQVRAAERQVEAAEAQVEATQKQTMATEAQTKVIEEKGP